MKAPKAKQKVRLLPATKGDAPIYKITELHGRGLTFLREHFPQVETVSDATENVQVTVDADDQVRGKPQQQSECALARACVRELKIDGAIIGLGHSYLIKGTHATRFRTGQAISREIVSFDRHSDFAAGTYQLTHISPASRFGESERNREREGLTDRKTRVRRTIHFTARVRRFA